MYPRNEGASKCAELRFYALVCLVRKTDGEAHRPESVGILSKLQTSPSSLANTAGC